MLNEDPASLSLVWLSWTHHDFQLWRQGWVPFISFIRRARSYLSQLQLGSHVDMARAWRFCISFFCVVFCMIPIDWNRNCKNCWWAETTNLDLFTPCATISPPAWRPSCGCWTTAAEAMTKNFEPRPLEVACGSGMDPKWWVILILS